MSLPIIGVTGDIITAKFYGNFLNERSGINDPYIRAVERAEGIPIILPVSKPEFASKLINNIDGLILSGGRDISPYNYGEEPLNEIMAIDPDRDAFEFALLKEALAKNKPILAICRGAQILNVLLGGSLYQDISYNKDFKLQHAQESAPYIPVHRIKTEKNTFINSVLGDEAFVNSLHHQVIKSLGNNLKVTASSSDGVIEAIEKTDSSFVIGVQWHPEILAKDNQKMQTIFNALTSNSK